MIGSVRCPECGEWHSTTFEKTSDEVGPDEIRRVEYTGRMPVCPKARVNLTLVKVEEKP